MCRWLEEAEAPLAGCAPQHDSRLQHVAKHGCSAAVGQNMGQGQTHTCKALKLLRFRISTTAARTVLDAGAAVALAVAAVGVFHCCSLQG